MSMTPSSTVCRCRRVLLVDDEAFNIIGLKFQFEKKGLQVISAKNGKQAIETLQETCSKLEACGVACRKFLFIAMDTHMPIMGGEEATRILRNLMKQGELPHIPIAICSGAVPGDRSPLKPRGSQTSLDYLAKPVNPRDLDYLIKKYSEMDDK
jgi:CheY-like chemotaxis protein